MSKPYLLQLEIAGPSAMWTRPDTGDCPVSYPAPTPAAVRGIFESILWLQTVRVVPVKVEICAPLVWASYTTNYGGPLRKSDAVKSGSSYQLFAQVLHNVRYRLYAEAVALHGFDGINAKAKDQLQRTTSTAHAYQAMFERRLARGQCHTTPCLGWKEFVPDYLGAFREDTRIQSGLNVRLPSFLLETFSQGLNSTYSPRYAQNAEISGGELVYAQ